MNGASVRPPVLDPTALLHRHLGTGSAWPGAAAPGSPGCAATTHGSKPATEAWIHGRRAGAGENSGPSATRRQSPNLAPNYSEMLPWTKQAPPPWERRAGTSQTPRRAVGARSWQPAQNSNSNYLGSHALQHERKIAIYCNKRNAVAFRRRLGKRPGTLRAMLPHVARLSVSNSHGNPASPTGG